MLVIDSCEDADLLERWRAGDRAAAQALVRRHYASVLRYFELNASWAAEDLAQRTFMASIEHPERVRNAAAFLAYLMGIARRQLALHHRELARAARVDAFDDVDGRTQLSTLLARNHEQILLLRALASLPRRAQLLLVLYYWENMRTPTLAEAFDTPVSTIRTQLERARALLRRRLDAIAAEGSPIELWRDVPELLASVLGAGVTLHASDGLSRGR